MAIMKTSKILYEYCRVATRRSPGQSATPGTIATNSVTSLEKSQSEDPDLIIVVIWLRRDLVWHGSYI